MADYKTWEEYFDSCGGAENAEYNPEITWDDVDKFFPSDKYGDGIRIQGSSKCGVFGVYYSDWELIGVYTGIIDCVVDELRCEGILPKDGWRYAVEYYNHYKRKQVRVIRKAVNAQSAIDKLCDQFGWGCKLDQYDADTRGMEWAVCDADTDGGNNYNIRISAERI